MNNYTTDDFSPIFTSRENPDKVGWYAATAGHKGLLVIDKLTPIYVYQLIIGSVW